MLSTQKNTHLTSACETAAFLDIFLVDFDDTEHVPAKAAVATVKTNNVIIKCFIYLLLKIY